MKVYDFTNTARATILESWHFEVPDEIEIPTGLNAEELFEFLADNQPEIKCVPGPDVVIGYEKDRAEYEIVNTES